MPDNELKGGGPMEHDRHEIIVEESTPSFGRVVIEPLERGYGVTLGNALRRVLLSSISGAAITAVRVYGALHEFSTVPGVQEDMIELLLNLKHVPVRSYSSEVRTVHLEIDGPKVVTAGDIQPDSEVEFVDPDAYICTLEENHHLSMDLYIEGGTGYIPIDRPRPAYLPIDALLIDAIFSPAKRVKYEIQDKRMGQRTDYDRLVLEVWTNGVVTPELAIAQASKILRGYFGSIANALSSKDENALEGSSIESGMDGSAAGFAAENQLNDKMKDNPALMRPVRDLELSVRSENCLLRGGVHLIGDLIGRSRADLLKIRNLGKISLSEIEDKLALFDLTLTGDLIDDIDDDAEMDLKED